MEAQTRETKFIETPITKTKVEIKTYITGREQQNVEVNAHENMVLKAKNLDKNKTPEMDVPVGNFGALRSNEYIKVIVVSVNDSKENILDTILDLPLPDFNFVAQELNKIIDGSEFDEKKTVN